MVSELINGYPMAFKNEDQGLFHSRIGTEPYAHRFKRPRLIAGY